MRLDDRRRLDGRGQRRLRHCTGTMLLLAALLACDSADPISPENGTAGPDPMPPENDASEVLPEGTFDVTLRACGECDPGVVPDYLVAFAGGVRGVMAITHATDRSAALRLLDMRASGSELDDIRDLFALTVIPLQRVEGGTNAAFRGAVGYGAAAEFRVALRPGDGELQCDFAVLHLKHDAEPTTCTVIDGPD